jgi:hypothetical protein
MAIDIDLAEFEEISVERKRIQRIQNGIEITLPPEFALTMHQVGREANEVNKQRSLTLEPPYGNPIYKSNTELDTWVRKQREAQTQIGRTVTASPQAATKGTYRRNRRS